MAAQSPLVDLLGDELTQADGSSAKVSDLQSKAAIGLYFSAHWCPPCRGFTPQLATIYMDIHQEKDFEIVFVSSDKNEDDFKQYMRTMPWKSLPYADRDLKEKLSKKFKVRGIPTLVFINPQTTEILTKNGRAAVMNDPKGDNFPWKDPTSVWEVLGKDSDEIITDAQDATFTVGSLKEVECLALYFSAHWCGPCRAFTPKLAETYKKLKASGKKFEILFVSSDRDVDSFTNYKNTHPWKSLAFDQRDKKEALSTLVGVRGIPTLALIDVKSGKVIRSDLRAVISEDADGKEYPWPKKPVNKLSEANAGVLNDQTSVIMFTGGSQNLERNALRVLKPLGEAEMKSDDPIAFFVAGRGDIIDRVKQFAGIKNSGLVILDIPNSQSVYMSEVAADKVDAEVASAFVSDFKQGKLKGTKLS